MVPFIFGRAVAFGQTGIVPGALLHTFVAGSSTVRIPTYSRRDGAEENRNKNPVQFDAKGQADIFLDPALSYHFVMTTRDGALIYDEDNWVPQVLNYSFDQTAAELAAGITPTDTNYLPGDARRYGVVGDGVADDADALENAAVGGLLALQGGTYNVSREVTLKNVRLDLNGDVRFVGDGSFRGVITNAAIPHSAFLVPYNLVTASERYATVIAGDYFIDPLLGDDDNSGKTAALPLRTVTAALEKIASVASTATDLKIVLRSGRYELPGVLMDATHTLTGRCDWIANQGEVPTFTGPLKWFFRNSPITATYGRFTAVANPLGYEFVDLYDAETGEQVECANNMRRNYSLPRNQAAEVTVAGTDSYTASITLTTEDATNFGTLSTTEKAGVRLRISHWFTSSWHMGLSLTGSVLTGDCQTNDPNYSNSWHTVSIDQFAAPYMLANLKTALNGENFCAYSDNVWLPQKGSNFFTVDRSVTYLINTGAAERHFFNGVDFRYLAVGWNKLKTFWTPGPFKDVGLLVGGVGQSGATSCNFDYTNVNGAVLSKDGATFLHVSSKFAGLCGFVYNTDTGCDSANLQDVKVRRWGHFTAIQSVGVFGAGSDIYADLLDCQNGPWCGYRFDSSANIVTHPAECNGTIRRSIAREIGYVDGHPADYIANNDSGVIGHYGGGSLAHYVFDEWIAGRSFAYAINRGVFGDDGVIGPIWKNGLAWGNGDAVLHVRDAGPGTHNVSYRSNILLGRVFVQATIADSDFAGNIVADGAGSYIDPNFTFSAPNKFGLRCDATGAWPVISSSDPNYTAVIAAATPFVRSFIQRIDFLGAEASGTSVPRVVTTSGQTVGSLEQELVSSVAGSNVIVLPTPLISTGRVFSISTTTANTVASSVSNVIPLGSNTPGTAILAATIGKWARMVCDGTNWRITQAN